MSAPAEKIQNVEGLTRFFNCSAGALLLGLATTLCLGNIVSAGMLVPHEPVLGLSIRALLWAFGGMTAAVAFLCLFWNQRGFPTACVALLAAGFVVYWLGLIYCGSRKPAVYLGSVPHVWGVSITTAGIVFAGVFIYLFLGSYALMVCSWIRARRNKPECYVKMACPSCQNRFEFPSGALGRTTPCPHCSASVTLTRAITKPSAAQAFTLIEMLVVIAVIGILAALLLPVLSNAKKQVKGVECKSNMHQLQIGWQLYADSNTGVFAVNGSGKDAGKGADTPSWVAGYLSTGNSSDNTDTEMLVGKEYQPWGSIGPYTIDYKIYHCPSDVSVDKNSGESRVRSISMNSWINPGKYGISDDEWGRPFEKYTKSSSFAKLSPANAFVFVDERPESINDGWFMVDMRYYTPNNLADLEVRDLPAIYHNNASSFAFADGHTEYHQWRDTNTLALKFKKAAQPTPNNLDVLWLMQHSTTPE